MPKPAGIISRFLALRAAWRRGLIITACCLTGLFALYALAGFYLAPRLIAKYAPPYAARQLDLQLEPGQIQINPLLFTIEITNCSIQEKGQPVFSLKRLFVDFETESLFRRAWTFADLAVEDPFVHLVIEADGRLNLARIAEKLPKSAEPEAAEKELPGLLLRHLLLTGGSVRLTDNSGEKPVELNSAPVAIELKNISTLAQERGVYTINAALPDGAKLGWQGSMTLKPIAASGTIDITGLQAATVFDFLQDQVNIAKVAGAISLSAGYDFSLPDHKPVLVVNLNKLALTGLTLAGKESAQPILGLKSLNVAGARIDLAARKIQLPGIDLAGCRLALRINQDGSSNWQNLIKDQPEEPEKPGWLVKMDALSIKGLAVRFEDESQPAPIGLEAQLDLLLSGARLDSGRKKAALSRLAVNGKALNLTRGPAGKEQKANPKAGQTDEAKAEVKQPWKLALDLLTVNGLDLGFVDRQSTNPLAYDLTGLQAEVTGLALPGKKPLTFALQSNIRQGGSLELTGTVAREGDTIGKIEAKIAIDRLNLKPLASLVAKEAALNLVSGDFSAKTHLLYTPGGATPSLALNGDVKLDNLLLNEEDAGARFLAWKELSTKGLDFSLNPDRLIIKELRLQAPGAKITIFKDKSLNLAKILKPKPKVATETTEKPPFPVSVESIRLKNGVVDFADFSLVLPFATRITDLKGGATDITTRPSSRTSLRFEGRVGEYGQAKAKGSLIPSNLKQFTDITVTFRNIAMSPLSPYSVTFAGREIASGKLNLNLDYKIKDSELLGDNSVVLKDFTLGDRVESPSAIDLPLDLAVSLLTDSEGKIDVAVPIRGNVDHPDFSYGHVIRQALLNLLTKIVTAPFRALGALFGGSSENLGTILFEPGRATLAPPEQEKLINVAEFLGKKKELKLTVHGGFDPALDARALKTARLRRTLRQDLGTKPGPMAYDNAKTQRALEELAGNTLAAFQAEYEEKTGHKAIRVNPVLALIGRASEDLDFYRALFDYLVETAPLPQGELEKLAEQRGMAIFLELTDRAGVNAARITMGAAVQSAEQDKSVPAKLELGVR